MPIILATWEPEIERSAVLGQPGLFVKPPFQPIAVYGGIHLSS
jgi:hypothetical protein